MQIQNVNSPNFNGISINASRMNNRQQVICDRLVNSLTYSDIFSKAHENLLDVFLLPGKGNTVKVAFLDKISDMFVKEHNKRINLDVNPNDNITNCSEIILSHLKNILNGNIARPKYNPDNVLLGKTDFARLRPDVHQSMLSAGDGMVDIEVIRDIDNYTRQTISEF